MPERLDGGGGGVIDGSGGNVNVGVLLLMLGDHKRIKEDKQQDHSSKMPQTMQNKDDNRNTKQP